MTSALAAKSAQWPVLTAPLTTIQAPAKSSSATYAAVTPSALKFVQQMRLFIANRWLITENTRPGITGDQS